MRVGDTPVVLKRLDGYGHDMSGQLRDIMGEIEECDAEAVIESIMTDVTVPLLLRLPMLELEGVHVLHRVEALCTSCRPEAPLGGLIKYTCTFRIVGPIIELSEDPVFDEEDD